MKALLLALVVVLTCPEMDARLPNPEANCRDPLRSASTVLKSEEGWDLSFINKAKVVKKGSLIGGGDAPNLVAINYAIRKTVIVLPRIQFNACDNSAVLANWYLMPTEAIAFERNGRLFAYLIDATVMGGPTLRSPKLGATMHVIYLDTRGTGVFDSVRIATDTTPPRAPEWTN